MVRKRGEEKGFSDHMVMKNSIKQADRRSVGNL
jgi:hypothetical protein